MNSPHLSLSGIYQLFKFWAKEQIAPTRIQAFSVRCGCLLILVIAGLLQPQFLGFSNLSAIGYSTAAIGVAAIGAACVTLSGCIFLLSTTAVCSIASLSFIQLFPMGMATAMLGTVCVGAIAGLIQGVLIGGLRANPIITSIAVSSLLVGAGTYFSGGQTLMAAESMGWFGMGHLLPGIPAQFAIFVVLAFAMSLLVEKTRAGRELTLIGLNEVAARFAGLRIKTILIFSCTLAGILASIAGAMLAAQSGTANLMVGSDLTFSAIAAVLVGGIAITGGVGRVSDAAFGAFFLSLLTNLMLINNLPYEAQLTVKGVVVLLSVLVSSLVGRKAA